MKKIFLSAMAVALMIAPTAIAASSVTFWPGNWNLKRSAKVVTDRGNKVVRMKVTTASPGWIWSTKAKAFVKDNAGKDIKLCTRSRSNSGNGGGITVTLGAATKRAKYEYSNTAYKTRCRTVHIKSNYDAVAGWQRVTVDQWGSFGRLDFVRYVILKKA